MRAAVALDTRVLGSGDHMPAMERLSDRLAAAVDGRRAVVGGHGHAIPRADGLNELLEAFWAEAEGL